MIADDMDARLRQAGERWRAANATPASFDVDAVTGVPDTSRIPVVPSRAAIRRPRWAWLAAAVVGAAAAAVVGLVIAGGGSNTPMPAVGNAPPLLGTTWHLTALTGANGASVRIVAPASLTVDRPAALGADDGCNHYSGPLSVRQATLDIGTLAGTAIGCTGPIEAQIRLIASVLLDAGTVHYSITGDELTLTRPGAGTLVYRAAPATGPASPP